MGDLLSGFRTFCRVVERGSLSRAGIDLDLAQATVSRHIQDLEAHYGATLLARSTRRIQLTNAGEQVYEYAKSVIRSESALVERLSEGKSTPGGQITIAGPSGFGHAVLNPFLVDFIPRHPNVRPRLLLSERSVNLIEDGIDVAIRIGAQDDSGLVIKPLGTLRECLVAAPALLQRHRVVSHPSDLIALPRIALTIPSTRQLTLQAKGRTHTESSAPTYEVDSSLALRDALLAGAGYGAIHEYLVRDAFQSGQLVRLLDAWSLPAWPINALFAYRARPHRVDILIEELDSYLQKHKLLHPFAV